MKPVTNPLEEDPSVFRYSEGVNFFASDTRTRGSFMGSDSSVASRLIRSAQVSERCLDLGSGDGRYVQTLLSTHKLVIAFDIDTGALSKLWSSIEEKMRARLMVMVGNAVEPLPFKSGSVDFAVCIGLLHFFPEDRILQLMDEIVRVLSPGGSALLEFSTDVRRIDLGDPTRKHVRRGHEYDESTARAVMTNALKDFCDVRIDSEHRAAREIMLYGRPFEWSSTDLYFTCLKSCQESARNENQRLPSS